MTDAAPSAPPAVSMIASLHVAHETRLDRVATLRRARVAFVSSEFTPDQAAALVGRCRGQVVALSDRPDVIVVPSTRHMSPATDARSRARVVDTAEFLAMHQAVVDAGDVSTLRLAVRRARMRLEEAVRVGGRLRAPAAPAPVPTGRSRMRTGGEAADAPRVDPGRDAVAEAFARRIDGVVQDRRARDAGGGPPAR